MLRAFECRSKCCSVADSTKFQLNLTPPYFSQYRVNDLFKPLGPLAFFSAKRYWSAPRFIQLHRSQPFEGFGFSVKEDNPVIIAMVESNSLAEFGRVREGDIIVAVGDKDVKWSSQSEVVHLIKNVKNTLSLKVVSPMEKEHNKACKLGKASAQHNSLRGSSEMSSPTGSMGHQSSSSKRIGWNLFKKYTHPRDGKYFYDNIILR